MIEIWRDIKDYEGLYQMSNLGRAKSLNYNHTGKEKILKPGKTGAGYLQVVLYKDGNMKHPLVHQLVAQAFLEPVPGKEYVDHINGIRDENWVELKEDENGNLVAVSSNLRWCTAKENVNFPLARENQSKAQNRPEVKENKSKVFTNRTDLSKPVLQFTKDGELIAEYPSAGEAARQTGYDRKGISQCCTGKRKQAYGFIWRFAS